MSAFKKTHIASKVSDQEQRPLPVQEVEDGSSHEAVDSPALQLQQALEDADFRQSDVERRPMSNTMLVLSLICVYALALFMMLGSLSA